MKVHRFGGKDDRLWNVRIHRAARSEILALGADEAARVSRKLHELAKDPLRPRPGADIKKLWDVAEGGLYRLRIGERRTLYAVVTAEREVIVLVVEDREVGYTRLKVKAEERLRETRLGQ